MLFIFSTPLLIRCLWQHKTVVFLHSCLIHAVLLAPFNSRKISFCALTKWQVDKMTCRLDNNNIYFRFIRIGFIPYPSKLFHLINTFTCRINIDRVSNNSVVFYTLKSQVLELKQ